MKDRHLLQWDVKEDRNAHRDGPLAKDKSVYSFIGWEGCHRGSLLLTKAEADFIRERLTSANHVHPCETCGGTGNEARHQICRDCD